MFLQFIKDAEVIKRQQTDIDRLEEDLEHYRTMAEIRQEQEKVAVKEKIEIERKMEEQEIEHSRTLRHKQDDYYSLIKIKDAELQTRINQAVEKEKAARMEAEMNLGAAKQEISILRSAFENLGFDVKDIKEILNKLIDGIISKNEVRILSTKE